MKRCLCSIAVTMVVIAEAAHGDLELNPGTRIVFGDGTSQSSALQSGLSLPAGHGGSNNSVSGASAYIGGGRHNAVTGNYTTVSGGGDSSASFGNLVSDDWGTVGGGKWNQAGDDAGTTSDRPYATVGGGYGNSATGNGSTVAGGFNNLASGLRSTVAGGGDNRAIASYAFAAGRNARADHAGAFVWGDNDNDSVTSTAVNQFKARARGGFVFVTSTPLGIEQGATLPSGGSAWESFSSREVKENVTEIDSESVLERVAQLPVHRWNYKHQDETVQHIGPFAEDFHAAFGLNGSYRGTISTLDADGVALAAIQGLNQKLEDALLRKKAEVAALRADLDVLKRVVEELRSRDGTTPAIREE